MMVAKLFSMVCILMGLWVSLPVKASDIVVQTAEQSGGLGGASAMAVAADAVTVAIGDASGNVSFWDLSRRQRLGQIAAVRGEPNGVQELQWVAGRSSILVVSAQKFAIWNRVSGQPVFEQSRAILFGQEGLVDLAASSNSHWIAMSSWSEAALLDTASEQENRLKAIPRGAGARLALDDQGQFLAVFGHDGLRMLALPKLDTLWEVPDTPPFEPGQLRFSPDQKSLLVMSGRTRSAPSSLFSVRSGKRTILPENIRQWQFLEDGRLLGLDENGCWHIWSEENGLTPSSAACRYDASPKFAVLKDGAVLAARRIFDVETGAVIGELPVNPRQYELAEIDEAKGEVIIAVSPALTDPDLMAWRDRAPARRYLGQGLYRWDLATGQQTPLPYDQWLAWIGQRWPSWCEPAHDPSVSYRWLSEEGELWLGLTDRIVRCANGKVQTAVQGLSAPVNWLRARSPADSSGSSDASTPALLFTSDAEGALSIYSLPDGQQLQRLRANPQSHSLGAGSGPAAWSSMLLDVTFTDADSLWFVRRDGVLDATGQSVFEGWIESHDRLGNDLVLGTDQGIVVIDLQTRKVRQTLETNGVAPVAIRQRDKRIYAMMPDSALRIYDRATGDWIVSAYRIGEHGSALIAPDGLYAASRTAVSALTRVDATGLQEFSGFDLERNRPDQVLARLGYASAAYLDAMSKLHEQRVRRLALQGTVNVEGEPLAWARQLSLQTQSPAYTLSIKVPQDGRLHVALSGVSVTPREGLQVSAGNVEVPVTLVPGDNRVTVTLETSTAVSSSPLAAFVHLSQPDQTPTTYLLGVGVSTYLQSQYDLRYAAKDIRDVANFFEKTLGHTLKTHLLIDAAATQDNVLQASRFLAQARPTDRVILYFAGHGLLSASGQYYFAPTDMDFSDPERKGLSFAQIEGLLDATPARARLLMLDSCHAGQNDEAKVGLEPQPQVLVASQSSPDQVSARGLRRVSTVPPSAPDLRRPLLEDVFVDLQMGSGAHIIAAAGAEEFALESPQWSNGVFTAAVLEGLGSRAADTDLDRRIHVDELRQYVANRVAELTQGRQLPTARAVNHEMPIVLAQASDPSPGVDAIADVRVRDGFGSALAYDPTGRFLVIADGQSIIRLDLQNGQRQVLPLSLSRVDSVVIGPEARYAVTSGLVSSDRKRHWIDFERFSVAPFDEIGIASTLSRPELTAAFTGDGQWFVIEGGFPERGLLVIPSSDPRQWRREDIKLQGFVDAIAGLAQSQVRLVDEYGEVVELNVASGQILNRWKLSTPHGEQAQFDVMAKVALGTNGRYFSRTYQVGPADSNSKRLLGVWDLEKKAWLFDRPLGKNNALISSSQAKSGELESYLNPALLAMQIAATPRLAMLDGASIRMVDLQNALDIDWAYRGNVLTTLPWAFAPDGERLAALDGQGQLLSWKLMPVSDVGQTRLSTQLRQ
ncbi:caspase family protein [Bordetella sp. 02P26C-1]|uniref:caspase family protein n=1 Tax=Bordetella sp. 02P26C-1 TaxID=2683195 RepID=UPI001355207A|nr:caspase family protein [Bordetella sp. 02P26C-1]MVW78368.1 hypothetical protein [Bordetella sp. 02P26C-1]